MADKNKTLAVALVHPSHTGAAQQKPIRHRLDGGMAMTPKDWKNIRLALDLLLVSGAAWIIFKLASQ